MRVGGEETRWEKGKEKKGEQMGREDGERRRGET